MDVNFPPHSCIIVINKGPERYLLRKYQYQVKATNKYLKLHICKSKFTPHIIEYKPNTCKISFFDQILHFDYIKHYYMFSSDLVYGSRYSSFQNKIKNQIQIIDNCNFGVIYPLNSIIKKENGHISTRVIYTFLSYVKHGLSNKYSL